MPEQIIQVLSTRPLSPELIMSAAEKGISIDVIPFIRTEAVEDLTLQQRIGVLGKQKLVAVFTSTNAVEVVGEWTKDVKEWTIFCIGAATQQLVSRHFGEGTIADTAESALELAQKIVDRRGAGDIFFFCGDLRREELPTTLRDAGFRVNELVVYRTKVTPSIVGRHYRGVVFFSPSAVESFFSMNGLKPETVLFAIGRTTAATIKRFCSNPVVVSEQPDAAILIRQVIKYFQIKQ